MHPSPITLWQVILVFVICTFNMKLTDEVIAVCLILFRDMACVSGLFNSLDLQDFRNFDSLILSNTLLPPVQISSCLLAVVAQHFHS